MGGPASATVTITSDEPVTQTVSVSASDASATEADLTTGRYTFTRAGSIAAALTVNYGVSGTATAGRDYTALGTSVSFPANVAKVTKTVTPLQDSRVEIDESIILTLVAGTGYAVGTSASAMVTLTSDDAAATVSVSAADSEAGLTAGTLRSDE
ncbi:MAG: hypothetical protein IPN92_10875 [Chromatiaceae bacterium]|nr:hypothetical protein [Chromatiaceae bacterium]